MMDNCVVKNNNRIIVREGGYLVDRLWLKTVNLFFVKVYTKLLLQDV